MGSIYLRKYGVAATVDFCLYELDGTDLQTAAVSAGGDVTLNRDEAGAETLDANAFTDLGSGYSLALSIAEMTASRIIVYVIDQTNPKAWLDKVLIVETYGNGSAQHVFDLATATVNLSAASEAQIDAIETDTNEIQGKLPTNKIMGSSVATDKDDEIDAIKAKTDLIGASVALETGGILANIHDTDLPDVHTDVGTAIANIGTVGGYVDTEVAAIKAVTDTLTLAAIADAVHDETTEAGMTHRQAINIMLAALAGKSTGGGTNTIKFKDQADTKPRITATVTVDGDRTAITNDGA